MIRNFLITLGLRKESAVSCAGARTGPAQPGGQKTVLIVDDNPGSLRAMRLALAHEPFRVETADSAASAVRKLFSVRPDLVLLEARIPAADGSRLARRLLADEGLASIPIMALTEMNSGTEIHSGQGSRFDGLIGKPAGAGADDAGVFAGQVRAFLESSRHPEWSQPWFRKRPAALPLLAPAADGGKQAAELLEAIEAGLPEAQFAPGALTELHRLAEAVGGSEDFELAAYLKRAERLSSAATVRARSRFRLVIGICRELIDRGPDVASLAELRSGYLDNRCAEMSRLEHALRNGDFATLRKAGHNLKGTGAAYGFGELTEIGRALEAAAKADDANAIEVLLDQIDAYIGIVRYSPEDRGDYAARI